MITRAYSLDEFDIKKMCRASLFVENKHNGFCAYISRRVFNAVVANPELPLFKTTVNIDGHESTWLATPMHL